MQGSLDAIEDVLEAGLHALRPKPVPYVEGGLCARPVGARERHGEIFTNCERSERRFSTRGSRGWASCAAKVGSKIRDIVVLLRRSGAVNNEPDWRSREIKSCESLLCRSIHRYRRHRFSTRSMVHPCGDPRLRGATALMSEDNPLPFGLPAAAAKEASAMKRLTAAWSATIEVKTPRLRRCRIGVFCHQ